MDANLWGRQAVVHVVAFEVPPAGEPRDERQRQALVAAQGAYARFAERLAQAGRGRVLRVSLTRPPPAAPAAPAQGAADEPFPVDLTRPVAARDVPAVRDALRQALERADAKAEAFVESVASCPDRKLFDLAMEALLSAKRPMALAAGRGLSRNQDPKVHEELLRALRAERDGGAQLVLLRPYGQAPGADVTAGLVDALPDLTPDAARLAWRLLSRRPPPELAGVQGRLVRAARGLGGLSDFFSRTAMALASGTQPPSTTGLATADGAFLPERFVSTGVAFVLDTHKDMDSVFWRPPPPPPEQQQQPARPGNDRRGRPREAPAGQPQSPPPQPVTRLGAAAAEVERALRAVARAQGKANVFTTGERSWQPRAASLERPQDLQGALEFLAETRSSTQRDVYRGLQQALSDPDIEEVHLLLCGTPIRSPGARDATELLEAVRRLNRERDLEFHVVLVLGPLEGAQDGPEAAARRDLLTALDTSYRAVADESGGRLLVRERLASLEAQPAPAQPPPGQPAQPPPGAAPPR